MCYHAYKFYNTHKAIHIQFFLKNIIIHLKTFLKVSKSKIIKNKSNYKIIVIHAV